ncbi:MAG TPA: HPr(Ser) kinase/phosphatase, partial [Thioalkalivibrio sp.]|nr:HPr(Ser) kinase/phosphatase [Thioalkalivibrio sp.]
MPESVTLADLVTVLGPRIGLRYVHGEADAGRWILDDASGNEMPMAGHLNLIRPNRIQVIGNLESR